MYDSIAQRQADERELQEIVRRAHSRGRLIRAAQHALRERGLRARRALAARSQRPRQDRAAGGGV